MRVRPGQPRGGFRLLAMTTVGAVAVVLLEPVTHTLLPVLVAVLCVAIIVRIVWRR